MAMRVLSTPADGMEVAKENAGGMRALRYWLMRMIWLRIASNALASCDVSPAK